MKRMYRRDFLRALGLGSVAAIGAGRAWGAPIHEGSRIVEQGMAVSRGGAAFFEDGKVVQPRREIPVFRDTDVLVVGGGTAGVLAALAAARAGVRVTLVERYGCFGGLWTAGLVLIVLCTHVRTGGKHQKVVQGIGDEMLARIAELKHGAINYGPESTHDATTDPEVTKYVMATMLREAGVDILLHGWVTNAIMDGNTIQGVLFESKSGCLAVKAKVVVDASGDGDVLDAAGAESVPHIHRIGLVHRLGNVPSGLDSKGLNLGGGTPVPGVRWVNMQGPQGDCLDIQTLTQCELDAREAIWAKLKEIQERPGYENVFLLDVASQLGVRASRTLVGTEELRLEECRSGKARPDVVGVGGSYSILDMQPCPIPYGTLVPKRVDNLLAAGRCVAADNAMLNYTRLIAPCMLTGHAAGAAAATAVTSKVSPRNVDVAAVQGLLKQQKAYLG
ncbi:MAG: FAD-dependent oxidoreductase [Candidatus Hydrogenedentes bacterium]|nr:FAD-dependent oxidoreductase [Candidatus Hydrogenedentota bacterium]